MVLRKNKDYIRATILCILPEKGEITETELKDELLSMHIVNQDLIESILKGLAEEGLITIIPIAELFNNAHYRLTEAGVEEKKKYDWVEEIKKRGDEKVQRLRAETVTMLREFDAKLEAMQTEITTRLEQVAVDIEETRKQIQAEIAKLEPQDQE